MAAITAINTQASVALSPPVSVDVRGAQSTARAAPAAAAEISAKVAKQQVQRLQTEKQPSEQEVQKAVEQATQEIASLGSSETIGFSYEKKLNLLFVQIKDLDSGEVVREVPSKDFIKHQIAVREMIGLILDKKA
ncbi:MAG: flagellar protein FlaG [Mariprofundaceae bacterium]